MVSIASFVLSSTSTPSAPGMPSFSSSGTAGGECNAIEHDADHYLAVIAASSDPDWLAPIQDNGDGYEMLRADSQVGARVSRAIAALECGSMYAFATGGAFATVDVELYRDVALGTDVTVKAGSTFYTSRHQRVFILVHDVVFPGASVGPVAATLRAQYQGYQWNVEGQRATATQILPGEIDSVQRMIQDPPFSDPTIRVRQLNDAQGGRAPWLDGLGADRGVTRRPNEADDTYRFRIRNLPDTVSPDAIVRNMNAIFSPYNVTPQVIETWSILLQTCFSAPKPQGINPQYHNVFVLNDPRSAPPYQNYLLGAVSCKAGLIVVVPKMILRHHGLVLNDPALSTAQLVSSVTGGARAISAYSIPEDFTPAHGYPCAVGADDYATKAVYAAAMQTMRAIKPAGVPVYLHLEGGV